MEPAEDVESWTQELDTLLRYIKNGETPSDAQSSKNKSRITVDAVDEALIMICGHGGRDARCGQLGPLLLGEFEEKVQRHKFMLSSGPREPSPAVADGEPRVRVGLMSHMGGHKWAGNVILYIPPSWSGHALRGATVWYGRVEPKHVEGIVSMTLDRGLVISELWRGGMRLSVHPGSLPARSAWDTMMI